MNTYINCIKIKLHENHVYNAEDREKFTTIPRGVSHIPIAKVYL